MKVEPSAYTIDDLEREGRTGWEGVRNYKARNLLRDEIQEGDGVLFYASNADPSGVTGVARVVRAGYPDPLQFARGNDYFDPKAGRDAPIWYSVDVAFVERFPTVVPLADLKANPALRDMMVTKRGARLSVQPVSAAEFAEVCRMGRGRRQPPAGRAGGAAHA
jgi:predicted RNA-binding protein with PUA-like domain